MVKLPLGLSFERAIEELEILGRLALGTESRAAVLYAIALIERERRVDGYLKLVFRED